MAHLFVQFRNGVTTPPFTDRLRPARTIGAALAAARARDTIEVLDTHNYREGELVIDKSITLVSSAGLDQSVPKPTQTGFRVARGLASLPYPKIGPRPSTQQRVLLIRGNQSGGPLNVTIHGFVIHGGRTNNARANDPAIGAGAGIAVVNVGTGREEVRNPSGVVIRECYFTNNRTSAQSSGQTSLSGLKTQLTNKIGSILSTMQRAVGSLGASDLSRRIQDTISELPNYFQSIPNTLPNHNLAGQSFGAGLCFVWSSGRVVGCRFRRNQVTGRGGGMAVVGYGWPIIEYCKFDENRALQQTRRDGGGLGIVVGIPDRLGRNLRVSDLSTDLEQWLQGLNSGQIARLAASFLRQLVQYTFSVIRGQQPRARVGQEMIGVIIHLILKGYLLQRRYQIWNRTFLQTALRARVLVRDSIFTNNFAFDDGGAVYASVLSRLRMDRCTMIGNTAGHGGGGAIRASLASDVLLKHCIVLNNQAEGDPGRVGGGACAFRNVQVVIQGNTLIQGNRCQQWAGGALQIAAESEGGATFMGGLVPSYYTAILVAVFEFERMTVHIDPRARITANMAGENQRSTHGKGGGLYILRGNQIDVRPLRVRISRYHTVVFNNTGHASPPRGTDTFHQIFCADLARNIRINDGNVRTYVQGDTFLYESGI